MKVVEVSWSKARNLSSMVVIVMLAVVLGSGKYNERGLGRRGARAWSGDEAVPRLFEGLCVVLSGEDRCAIRGNPAGTFMVFQSFGPEPVGDGCRYAYQFGLDQNEATGWRSATVFVMDQDCALPAAVGFVVKRNPSK